MTAGTASAIARRLLEQLDGGQLDDAARETLSRLVRAAADSRPSIGILVGDGRARRDALLREIADEHFAGKSATTTAKEIARKLRAYAAGAWRRDRLRARCPHPPGALQSKMHTLMSLGDAPSWKTALRALNVPTNRGGVGHGDAGIEEP